MLKKSLLAGAGIALMSASPLMASTTLVGCEGYLIGITDELVIEGQARAGSEAAFEKLVCDRSAELDPTQYDKATVVPVFVEELNMSTRVILFPEDNDS